MPAAGLHHAATDTKDGFLYLYIFAQALTVKKGGAKTYTARPLPYLFFWSNRPSEATATFAQKQKAQPTSGHHAECGRFGNGSCDETQAGIVKKEIAAVTL